MEIISNQQWLDAASMNSGYVAHLEPHGNLAVRARARRRRSIVVRIE
jgi:hypothetical protein